MTEIKFTMIKEHYTADVVTVWCFDARVSSSLPLYLSEIGATYHDPISPTGGANVLSRSGKPIDKQSVLSQIADSIRLHHTRRIALMMHQDCGALGYSKAFGNDWDKEQAELEKRLAEAKTLVNEQFPGIPVDLVLVSKDKIVIY